MTIRNLEHAVHPKSVVVIGASDREGSVGRVVMRNIIDGGFEGRVWPVNPKYSGVAGQKCFAAVGELPDVPDLAVIVTPAITVPGIIAELGAKGTRAAIVISAGLTAANGLKQAMLDAAKPHLFRIIGPNTLGLLIPPIKLNASFSHLAARPGGIALLSQSGAIVTSFIDWAAGRSIGFSQIVSLGDMADADIGDYLDLLAGDAATKAIVLYLESIPNPRKFMSAARAAARLKPVIAIKSGRHAAAAKAAQTHTGALSGADRVTDAALRRAGILWVRDLDELFSATQTIGRFPPLSRASAVIVTNGGGAGVLAVDHLMDRRSEMAVLAPATIAKLNALLPANWSGGNPVDIIGDAPPERYKAAIEAVSADPGVDVVVVMNCPTALGSSVEAARAVASLAKNGLVSGKPMLTCWLGAHTARDGRAILEEAGVASYETPADVAAAVSYLVEWSQAQAQLTRVPASHTEGKPGRRETVLKIFRHAASQGRSMLSEPEAKAAISAYGIAVPETRIARDVSEVAVIAGQMLRNHEKIAVKLLSRTMTHKSDVGGVALNLGTVEEAQSAAMGIADRLKAMRLEDDLDGFTIQPMIARKHAHELILGVSHDRVFGPVILFGAGGVAVEVTDDTAIALPPLDDLLAGDLIDATRISRLLAGYRDRKPANRQAIMTALNAVSQMTVDFPGLASMDINPLLADSDGVIALDARIEILPDHVERTGPNPDLAIRPYPACWEKTVTLDGRQWTIRPIRPADVSLYPAFLAQISADDIRLRFMAARPFTDQMLLRLTQLDYNREMAFVLLDAVSGEMAGIARFIADPDHEKAEYAILVRSDLQGIGLGWALMEQLIAYATADGLTMLEGFILTGNARMIAMARQFGFRIGEQPNQAGQVTAMLRLPASHR